MADSSRDSAGSGSASSKVRAVAGRRCTDHTTRMTSRCAGSVSFPYSAVIVFLTAALVYPSVVECVAEVPSVCDGVNPLHFENIDAHSDDKDVQLAALVSLGRKLANPGINVVRLYCVLHIENETYAPGYCPGEGHQPVHTLKSSDDNETLSLAFVYGKTEHYTESFLKIMAPTGSLELLNTHVAWKADQNQTLNVSLGAGESKRLCWEASTTQQRLAFLVRLVNETLTRAWRRVTGENKHLSGHIYVRSPSDKASGLSWPYPQGATHQYLKCDNAYLPEDFNYTSAESFNFTVCSRWELITKESNWEDVFWTDVGYASIAIAYLIVLLGFVKFTFKTAEALSNKEILLADYADDGVANYENFLPKFDGTYPQYLNVMHLAMTSKWNLFYRLSVVVPLVLFLIVAVVFNVGGPLVYVQSFDTLEQPLADCHSSGVSSFTIGTNVAFVVLLVLSIAFYLYFMDSSGFKGGPHDKKKKHLIAFVLIGGAAFVLPTFILNILVTLSFLLIGAAINYGYYMLGILAMAKVLLFDVLHIGKVNVTLNPDIALCKRAVDRASFELQNYTMDEYCLELWREGLADSRGSKKSSPSYSAENDSEAYLLGDQHILVPRGPTGKKGLRKMVQAMPAPMETSDTDGRQRHVFEINNGLRQFERYITPTIAPDGNVSSEERRAISEAISLAEASMKSFIIQVDRMRARVFFLLCARHGVVRKPPVMISENTFRTIHARLVETIAVRCKKFALKALLHFGIVLLMITSAHLVLIHVGELTDSVNTTALFVPLLVVMRPVFGKLMFSNSKTPPTKLRREDQLTADAKRFTLLLIHIERQQAKAEQRSVASTEASATDGPRMRTPRTSCASNETFNYVGSNVVTNPANCPLKTTTEQCPVGFKRQTKQQQCDSELHMCNSEGLEDNTVSVTESPPSSNASADSAATIVRTRTTHYSDENERTVTADGDSHKLWQLARDSDAAATEGQCGVELPLDKLQSSASAAEYLPSDKHISTIV